MGFILRAVLAASLLAVPALVPSPRHEGARAQTAEPPSDAVTPVDEFSKQVEDLKKNLGGLNKRIEDGAKSIEALTDVKQMRKEIEEMRAIVAGALGAVSDNADVAQLGVKALNHAREKLKQLERESRFTKEQQQFLANEWRRIITETEKAGDDLGQARQEFTQLLRVLQTREDFLEELIQIRKAQEAVEVIRNLTREIREASDTLRSLIRQIKPPGT